MFMLNNIAKIPISWKWTNLLEQHMNQVKYNGAKIQGSLWFKLIINFKKQGSLNSTYRSKWEKKHVNIIVPNVALFNWTINQNKTKVLTHKVDWNLVGLN